MQPLELVLKVLVIDYDSDHLNYCQELLSHSYDAYFISAQTVTMNDLITIEPHIILFDFEHKKDAKKFCHELQTIDKIKDAWLILMASHYDANIIKYANALGCSDFVTKPIIMETIKNKLKYISKLFIDKNKVSASALEAQHFAKVALSSSSELGVVLEAIKNLVNCTKISVIADIIFAACARYELMAFMQVNAGLQVLQYVADCSENGYSIVTDEYDDNEGLLPVKTCKKNITDSMLNGKIIKEEDGIIIHNELLSIYLSAKNKEEDITEKIDHMVMILNAAEDKIKKISALERASVLQEEIKEALESNRSKTAFITNVSHELRTPLHAIINYTKLSEKDLDLGKIDRAKSGLSIIHDCGVRLLALINNILDIAKMESGKCEFNFQECTLDLVISDSINELKSLAICKSIDFEFNYDEGINSTLMDVDKIQQVVVNILSNAIKFSPEGSKIKISVNHKEIVQRRKSDTLNTNQGIIASFQDQGAGVSDDELSKIFDKFVQVKQNYQSGGTGLGLSICHDIIHAHHGRIWAENCQDGGLAIKFILPCLDGITQGGDYD